MSPVTDSQKSPATPRRARPVKPLVHGTVRGYHRCNKETPGGSCKECKEAFRVYQRELRAKRRRENPPVPGYNLDGTVKQKPGPKPKTQEQRIAEAAAEEKEVFLDPASFKHGTMAAYNKCLKTPQGPCDKCAEAARVKSRDRRAKSSVAAAQGSQSFQEALLEEPTIDGTVDELDEARENLRIVRAAMNSARSARDMAPLSKQRVELVKLINDLEQARGEVQSTVGDYSDEIGNVLRPDFGDSDAPDQVSAAR